MKTPTEPEANFLARTRLGVQTRLHWRRLAMIERMIEKGWIVREADDFEPTPEGLEALNLWRAGKGLTAIP